LTARTRSTIQSPSTIRAPSGTQPVGRLADERASGRLRPPLDADRSSRPAAVGERPRDRVERVLIAVEDRIVEHRCLANQGLVTLVVEEDEALVVSGHDDAERGARRIPDRLEPGQIAEVRRAHDEEDVDVPASHLVADAASAVAVLRFRERQRAVQRSPQSRCSAHTASMSAVA
jgi:hypothetical protein